jgi:acyl-CoA thioesterase-2
MWARSMQPLGDDPRTHLCALTYLSDVFTGLALVPGFGEIEQLTSLDHAVWFYRPVQLDDWVLIDFVPESTAAGRGTYSARVFAADGRLVAGIAQESLFRKRR